MRRLAGVPGLVVGLIVLVLAIGIGVWVTSSGGGGGSAPIEQEDDGGGGDDHGGDRSGSNSGPG